MPRITIRGYASLQRLLSSKPIEIVTKEITLKELIELLSERFSDKIKEELYDDNGGLSPKYQIFVNGKDVRCESGLSTLIKDGNLVLISPIVDGG